MTSAPATLARLASAFEGAGAAAGVSLPDLTAALSVVVVRTLAVLLSEQVSAPPAETLRRRIVLGGDGSPWARLLDELHRFDPGSLFDPERQPCLRASRAAPVTRAAVEALLDDLLPDGATLPLESLGAAHETLMGVSLARESNGRLTLEQDLSRRRAGAHYTPSALADSVVERALAPLLDEHAKAASIRALRVCDPAMGGGVFLLATCRHLARRLREATRIDGGDPADELTARREIARHCLRGVDKDPRAVELSRVALFLLCRETGSPSAFLAGSLRHGDALVEDGDDAPLSWAHVFPDVLAGGGFDALVGNPPWVSYAGRAAQPLADEVRQRYARSPAFAGFRNLQALFVRRSAELLRPSGRLGFVLPTSMSDLGGYEPSRRAHDALCVPDDELPDFESGGFDGVFQPCMALFSTRRPETLDLARTGVWPLRRTDLDAETASLLHELSARPTFPPETFGERGYQTTRGEVARLQQSSAPTGRFRLGLRVGGDIEPFLRRAPRLHGDPDDLHGRLRSDEEWRAVAVLVRQTARFPIAALSDGGAFRNSLLAAFASPDFPADFLVAYLNASPVRFFHYVRHRDARQGMPQMKIAHLRALPAPDVGSPALARLASLGRSLSRRNTGVTAREQRALDELAADTLGLSASARSRIARWASEVVVPSSRARASSVA